MHALKQNARTPEPLTPVDAYYSVVHPNIRVFYRQDYILHPSKNMTILFQN